MTLDQDETLDQAAPTLPGAPAGRDPQAPWTHERRPLARFWEAFRRQPVLNGFLAALCIAAIVLAILAIGPASESGAGETTRTTTVKRGVVQSTVSGSGSIASASDLNLGFKTSGTVTHIYVKEGEEVAEGQLLATVDPQSAEVSLQQAEATLKSAEANLAQLEENEGESSSGSSEQPLRERGVDRGCLRRPRHDRGACRLGAREHDAHDEHRTADHDHDDARHHHGTGHDPADEDRHGHRLDIQTQDCFEILHGICDVLEGRRRNVHRQTERSDPRSEPRFRTGDGPERQAERSERRKRRREHQARGPRVGHDRLAVRGSRRDR